MAAAAWRCSEHRATRTPGTPVIEKNRKIEEDDSGAAETREGERARRAKRSKTDVEKLERGIEVAKERTSEREGERERERERERKGW